MSADYRILICEPNAASGQTLRRRLVTTACKLVWCTSSAEATELVADAKVDAAVVFFASDGVGLDVIDRIRETSTTVPVLVATLPDELETRILGLNRGAEDYLIWPFNADEIVARVSTVLCRRNKAPERFLRRGKVVLDRETGRFGDGSNWTVLSPKERQVFSLLLESGTRPVSKKDLKVALADGAGISDNAIEVGIYRLRAKARSLGMRIQAYRGLGYVLEEAEESVLESERNAETIGSRHAVSANISTALDERRFRIPPVIGSIDGYATGGARPLI